MNAASEVLDSPVYELMIWKQRSAIYRTFLKDDSKLLTLEEIKMTEENANVANWQHHIFDKDQLGMCKVRRGKTNCT